MLHVLWSVSHFCIFDSDTEPLFVQAINRASEHKHHADRPEGVQYCYKKCKNVHVFCLYFVLSCTYISCCVDFLWLKFVAALRFQQLLHLQIWGWVYSLLSVKSYAIFSTRYYMWSLTDLIDFGWCTWMTVDGQGSRECRSGFVSVCRGS